MHAFEESENGRLCSQRKFATMGLPPNKKRALEDASSQESVGESEDEEIVPTCEEEEDDSDEDDSDDESYSSPVPLVSGNTAGVLYDTYVLDFETDDEDLTRYRTDSTTLQAAALRNYYAKVVEEHGEQGQKFFAAYFWHAIEKYKPRWWVVEGFESGISRDLMKVAEKIQKDMRQIFQMQGTWEAKISKTIYSPIDWPSAHVYTMQVFEKGGEST
jgi:hypothetical protein